MTKFRTIMEFWIKYLGEMISEKYGGKKWNILYEKKKRNNKILDKERNKAAMERGVENKKKVKGSKE